MNTYFIDFICSTDSQQILGHVGVEPVNEVAGLDVNAGMMLLSTAIAPRHHSSKLISTHEGSARVALTGILAPLVIASADHRVLDFICAIIVATLLVRHHRHLHLLQSLSQMATLGCGSPSGYCAHGSLIVFGVRLWQFTGLPMVTHSRLVLQLQQADIVLNDPAVVVLMPDDRLYSNVLLVLIVVVELVVANCHSKVLRLLVMTAVASCDHPSGGDQRAAAHQTAVHTTSQQGDLVGELTVLGVLASNDSASTAAERRPAENSGRLGCSSSSSSQHCNQQSDFACCPHCYSCSTNQAIPMYSAL